MLQLFKDRNFLFFWIGHLVSVIGDHVSFIAFPWLVLQMTGSPAMTGAVLAVQGLPRALLMLPGGAVVDRTSPRMVMMLTNGLRFFIVAVLGYLVAMDAADLVTIFALALVFGIADAFFYPANTAILPSLVKKEMLQSANALVQTTVQLGVIIGPVLAGFVIAGEINTAAHDGAGAASTLEEERLGLARAFYLDAVTFFVSAISLLFVRTRALKTARKKQSESLTREVKEAIRFVWSIPAVRLSFLGIAFLEFFYQAPVFVGLPVLAKARFSEGALMYGMMVGAYGAGALVGGLTGGLTPAPRDKNLTRLMFVIFAYSGATIGLIVFMESYKLAMLLFFTAGLGDAYIWVHYMTWLQKLTPEPLMGRVMSIFMLMAVGLLPIANLIMGLVFEWHLEGGLVASSLIIVIACLLCALHSDTRRVHPVE